MAKHRHMVDRRCAGIVLAATFLSTDAHGRIQDYQIVRLITYKTDCQIERVERRRTNDRSMRFFVTCTNVTFYPDGIDIACTDADDDRSCTVKTQPRSFDQLHLLMPHG